MEPRLEIAKLAAIEVFLATEQAAYFNKNEDREDFLCPSIPQNTIAVSTSKEEHATRYQGIQEINTLGTLDEVSAVCGAPHDTVTVVIRGVPTRISPREVYAMVVNVRNPTAVATIRTGSLTTVIVAFDCSQVPNFVTFGLDSPGTHAKKSSDIKLYE